MKVNANQITALRIVLLPLPLFLIYGDTTSRLWALAIFTCLGLTDYLDGLLARRYGVTALGKLLDPIADKIFVAVTLVPLIDLNILPLWIVWPIFLREFLVTQMRCFMMHGHENLKVTELAKIKTTIQMIGVGLILLLDMYPDGLVTISFLSGLFMATLFLAIAIYSKYQILSQRLKVALVLEMAGLLIAMILDAHDAILVYGMIILLITLVSGVQYLVAAFPCLYQKGMEGIWTLISTITIPLVALWLLPHAPSWAHLLVVLILSLEFASQGIDIWALQEGRDDLSHIRKRIIMPLVFGLPGLLYLFGISGKMVILSFLGTAVLLSFIYLAMDIWKHRDLFGRGAFF